MSPILRFFETGHLPGHLATVGDAFRRLATDLDAALPDGPEKSVCLRKLLEAKDAGVRSALTETWLKARDEAGQDPGVVSTGTMPAGEFVTLVDTPHPF